MYVCVGVCVARYAATAERTCKKYQEKRAERRNSGAMQQQHGPHAQLEQEPQQHQHSHHLHEQPQPLKPQQPQQAPSATPDAGAKRKRIQPQLLQHYTQDAGAAAAAASHMGDMSIAAQERGEQRDAVWTSMSSTSLPAAAAAAPAAAAISNAPNNPTVRITIQLLNGEQLQATSPAFSRANHVTCPTEASAHTRACCIRLNSPHSTTMM